MSKNTKILLILGIISLSFLACGSTTPRRLYLYPTTTPNATQTPVIVNQTVISVAQETVQVIVEVTPTPAQICVISGLQETVTVNLRPSPSDSNYPIKTLKSGDILYDLGGRDGKWWFVRHLDKSGWIDSKYVGGCN